MTSSHSRRNSGVCSRIRTTRVECTISCLPSYGNLKRRRRFLTPSGSAKSSKRLSRWCYKPTSTPESSHFLSLFGTRKCQDASTRLPAVSRTRVLGSLTLEEDKRKEAQSRMSEPERILAGLAEERMSDEEKFQRRQNDLKKGAFVHWLASSDDIFWIIGKAGSGKSTLIKLIDDDPRTKEGLSQWIDNICVRDESWWIQSGLVRGCCVAHDEALDKSVRKGADSLEALATLRARKLSEDLKGMLNSIKRILPESSEGQLQTETHDNRMDTFRNRKTPCITSWTTLVAELKPRTRHRPSAWMTGSSRPQGHRSHD